MADATTTTNKGFLGGIFDGLGTILDKAAPAVSSYFNAQAAGSNAANNRDAYGRSPGQAGYGTAVPPAGLTASGLPSWVKPVAIGVGVLLGLGLLWKLFAPSKK